MLSPVSCDRVLVKLAELFENHDRQYVMIGNDR